MIEDSKFLFVFRMKLSSVEYSFHQKGMRHTDETYYAEYLKHKSVQSGWMDAVERKEIINTLSYPLGGFGRILPYGIFLRIMKLARKVQVITFLDRIALNVHVVYKMVSAKCDVLVYYDSGIFQVTDALLLYLNKSVIEYDGRATSVSKRSLSREIKPNGKILCSNMDWSRLVSHNKQNLRIIKLGVNRKWSDEFGGREKDIDVFVAGSIDDRVWSKRGVYLEFLLENVSRELSIKIVGNNCEDAKYPLLQSRAIGSVYGDDFYSLLARARMSIVIVSDEHDRLGCGMPMRFYENAAFEVFQLVYETRAYRNTRMEPGEDFEMFESKEDMVLKLLYYHRNPNERLRMVKSAKRKFNDYYQAQDCFRELLSSCR